MFIVPGSESAASIFWVGVMGRPPERPTFLSDIVSPFGPLEGMACVTESHDSYIPVVKTELNGRARLEGQDRLPISPREVILW